MNPDATWTVVYPDGRMLSDTETDWNEIAVRRDVGVSEKLSIAKEELASLSAHVGGRSYTLRSPGPGTHFFRHYGTRMSLGGDDTRLYYHAIGYITKMLRLTLEIDGRGNAVLRPLQLLDDTYDSAILSSLLDTGVSRADGPSL